MQTDKRVAIVVVAAVPLVFISLVVLFLWDPKTTVRLTNDYETEVDLSSCGGTSAKPGQRVSLPIEIFDAHPCFLYAGDGHHDYSAYLGCLQFDPLVNHQTVLSSVVSDISVERCWDTAPR